MTKKLLGSIRANRIPAIGFVNEERLHRPGEFNARVGILRMWLDAGLELGNHTFSHLDLQTTPLAAYEADVIRGQAVTARLLREKGMKLRYFRYPYLDVGPNLATRRAFERFLTSRGYRIAPVTIDSEGYMFAAVYARALARGDREASEHVAQAYLLTWRVLLTISGSFPWMWLDTKSNRFSYFTPTSSMPIASARLCE